MPTWRKVQHRTVLETSALLPGTFLEGERLEKQAQAKLRPGMRFRVGTSPDEFTLLERQGGSNRPTDLPGKLPSAEIRPAQHRANLAASQLPFFTAASASAGILLGFV